jgi:hypothetical protein
MGLHPDVSRQIEFYFRAGVSARLGHWRNVGRFR